MAKQTAEELIISRIEGTIRGIKSGRKSPNSDEAETERRFTRLKGLNVGMHDELLTKYNQAVLYYKPANISGTRAATKAA